MTVFFKFWMIPCYINIIVTSFVNKLLQNGVLRRGQIGDNNFTANKNFEATRVLREFPRKTWKLEGLKALLRKFDSTGSSGR